MSVDLPCHVEYPVDPGQLRRYMFQILWQGKLWGPFRGGPGASEPRKQLSCQNERTAKNGKTAPVCRILILEQIKLQKKGFRSLKERQINFYAIYNYHNKNLFFCRISKQNRSRPVYHVLRSERTHWKKRENGLWLPNSIFSANLVIEKRLLQS